MASPSANPRPTRLRAFTLRAMPATPGSRFPSDTSGSWLAGDFLEPNTGAVAGPAGRIATLVRRKVVESPLAASSLAFVPRDAARRPDRRLGRRRRWTVDDNQRPRPQLANAARFASRISHRALRLRGRRRRRSPRLDRRLARHAHFPLRRQRPNLAVRRNRPIRAAVRACISSTPTTVGPPAPSATSWQHMTAAKPGKRNEPAPPAPRCSRSSPTRPTSRSNYSPTAAQPKATSLPSTSSAIPQPRTGEVSVGGRAAHPRSPASRRCRRRQYILAIPAPCRRPRTRTQGSARRPQSRKRRPRDATNRTPSRPRAADVAARRHRHSPRLNRRASDPIAALLEPIIASAVTAAADATQHILNWRPKSASRLGK